MRKKQFLLCIPAGGFTDTLTQLGKAWQYAQNNGRRLIVYTAHRDCGLHGPFTDYFSTDNKNIILHPSDKLINYLEGLSVYPPVAPNNILCDNTRYDRELNRMLPLTHEIYLSVIKRKKAHEYAWLKNHTKNISDTLYGKASFDFSQRYSEELLVHHSAGGGVTPAFPFLEQLTLRPSVAEHIRRALLPLGDDYDAVHVRNTDYRTDYMALFKKIFPEVQRRKLLICSDDRQCITVAEKFFVDSDVTTVTAIPDTGGKPLHLMTTNTAENNTMMLTDLFALAGAKRLFFSSTTMERPLSSGFSRLAEGLRLRPDIRARLFGGSVREAAAGAPEISGAGDI